MRDSEQTPHRHRWLCCGHRRHISWHPQVINAPPTDDHAIVEAQVRDHEFPPAQQDEIWRRWREGQSFSLIGRAPGAPMQHARRFLYQSGGVRLAPQTRSERHLSGSEREEISRGIAAGESGWQLAKRLGRSLRPSPARSPATAAGTAIELPRPMQPPTNAGADPSRPSLPSGLLCVRGPAGSPGCGLGLHRPVRVPTAAGRARPARRTRGAGPWSHRRTGGDQQLQVAVSLREHRSDSCAEDGC